MSRTATTGAAVITAWVLGVALAFLYLEPSGTVALTPALAGLRGLGVAMAAVVACMGAGGAILARLQPDSLEGELGWLHALGLGLALWGLISWPAAALLGVNPWVGAGLTVALATGWLFRPPVALPRVRLNTLAWALLFLTPAALAVLSPITDTDELYYHLALPARLLEEGALLGGPLMPNGSRPLALHLPYTWLLGLGGIAAPRALHLLLAAGLLLAVHQRATAWWGAAAGAMAPLLLLGSTSFLATIGLAYADIPAALLVLLAVDAGLAGQRRTLAVAGGGALAIKYTAVLGIAPLFALLAIRAMANPTRRSHTLGALVLAGLGAVAVVAPWWLRNLLDGLHPLFPFAGWQDAGPFVFQFPEKYGMGHGWLDTLLLPWNLTFHAEHDSMVFLGRINPAFLALLPAGIWAAWRDSRVRMFLGIAAAGLLLWSFGTQWLRYLLPVLPLAALAAAAGLSRLPRWATAMVAVCWLLGLPSNLRPVLATAQQQAPVALGLESANTYLQRELTAWPAIQWINQHSPADARVALLYSWQAALIQRPWVMGSVEDHVPTRHFLALHDDQALQQLREVGVTHVLTSRVNFLRKSYPFLDEAAFEEQFEAPERQLEDALLQDAVLMFEQGRHAVYAL